MMLKKTKTVYATRMVNIRETTLFQMGLLPGLSRLRRTSALPEWIPMPGPDLSKTAIRDV